jgi:hypothetical protein
MDVRRTYDFMGDNARRFLGLPIANPDTDAVNPPALVARAVRRDPNSQRRRFSPANNAC